MFYIKNNKCKVSKKYNYKKNFLSADEKIKHSLIMYAYLTEQGVVGWNKRDFKKWFKNNKKEIIDYYTGRKNEFYGTFFSNDEVKNKLELVFNHNEKLIYNLVDKNGLNNESDYQEFLKVNKEYNKLLDFLKKMQMNNFNEFFIYINSLLLPKIH